MIYMYVCVCVHNHGEMMWVTMNDFHTIGFLLFRRHLPTLLNKDILYFTIHSMKDKNMTLTMITTRLKKPIKE